MSIVSTIYPDPRRSLARESARCRRSPLPRRSLPVDVVDDRCDPSVFELTRLEPLLKAPANADSLLSGFGFDPVICRNFSIEDRLPRRCCTSGSFSSSVATNTSSFNNWESLAEISSFSVNDASVAVF